MGDGVATNTAAIQAAIAAASAVGGGTVEVPAGVSLSGPIRLASGINLRVDGGATLRMLPLDKYPGGTTDGPFGVYHARGVRLVDCRIITPAGTHELSRTNADVTVSGR